MTEQGKISIHAENILPIIKKWLYSEKEIFLREIVSNSIDAMQKLEKLSVYGEVETEVPEPKVTVTIDKDKGTLTVTDTGLGMTAEEVKKYIAQVAFSSLEEFVAKYQDKDLKEQNIGHFGLGFYSSFMVATKVEIDTLSYQKDAKAVLWSCDGSIDYSLSDSGRKEIGTSIIMHVAEDSKEMLEVDKIREILERFCRFVKYPLFLGDKQINDPVPLWTKSASTLSEKDYTNFFSKLFPTSPHPLFWIHLSLDYPFKLSGILYFPKLRHELDSTQGEVQMYCNQVFVAENIKEVLPDWLTLLKGAIDCPDLPLNVSRSYLQNDPVVKKISGHIIKKVADKLTGMASTDRESYEKAWDDIHGFIKFGMIRDRSFYDRMENEVLYKTSGGQYLKMPEYIEKYGEKTDQKILYASDEQSQATILDMLRENDMDAVLAPTMIDQHFIQYVEMYSSGKFKFERVDANVAKHLTADNLSSQILDPKDAKNQSEKIGDIFRQHLSREKVKVRVEPLKTTGIPAMLLFDENIRRMQEMAAMNPGSFRHMPTESEHTLVINLSNPAIKHLLTLAETFHGEEKTKLVVNQIYDLAFLQQGQFTPEMMRSFVERSTKILQDFGGASPNKVILETSL